MTDGPIPAAPKRSVKPRRRSFKRLPVVAVHGSSVLVESGEVSTVDRLVHDLPSYSSTLFAKLGSADFVAMLSSRYLLSHGDRWQWRVSTHERELVRPNDTMQATRMSTVVHYFGWKGGSYHKIIDPVSMHGHRLSTMFPGSVSVVVDPEWETLTRLLKWGIAIRNFCAENDIEVRPTTGAMGAQFLTDKRFYPKARRKVPAAINQRTRENLPGNHYYLNVKPSASNNFTAHYLDQYRAHHYHAQTTALPDSDHCFAYGSFRELSEIAFDRIDDDFCGLYCLDLCAPSNNVPFDWIGDNLNAAFVYSNEIPHLLDLGYSIVGVRSAWGSRRRDTGLPAYAKWAQEQLDQYSNQYGDSPWLKQLLLSTYGTLATRSKHAETVFRLANAGEPTRIRTGRRELNGKLARTVKKLEPGTVNVLQRGMIEAACRSDSVGLAQWLNHQGHTILSIYADAVIVEADDDNPLPFLPQPWRSKKTLNHLQFISQQAFQSDSMVKLPGVSREIRAYRQHRKPGHAPRVVQYEALTDKTVQTDRRI